MLSENELKRRKPWSVQGERGSFVAGLYDVVGTWTAGNSDSQAEWKE